jgi:hypothetical protein
LGSAVTHEWSDSPHAGSGLWLSVRRLRRITLWPAFPTNNPIDLASRNLFEDEDDDEYKNEHEPAWRTP